MGRRSAFDASWDTAGTGCSGRVVPLSAGTRQSDKRSWLRPKARLRSSAFICGFNPSKLSAIDFVLPPEEEGECVEPLMNAVGEETRGVGGTRRCQVHFPARIRVPPSRSCVLAWRSWRLGERRSSGRGRRRLCDVRIFSGGMLIFMKQIGIKKRLCVWRVSFKFEVSSLKQERRAASGLPAASHVRLGA
jgi:hypothetical protein